MRQIGSIHDTIPMTENAIETVRTTLAGSISETPMTTGIIVLRILVTDSGVHALKWVRAPAQVLPPGGHAVREGEEPSRLRGRKGSHPLKKGLMIDALHLDKDLIPRLHQCPLLHPLL